jgi:hypothetical protein
LSKVTFILFILLIKHLKWNFNYKKLVNHQIAIKKAKVNSLGSKPKMY